MQSCNVAGLFEVNNYICTYLIRWHELSNSKEMCLSPGENCSHVVEKATSLQRQPGAPERFKRDLSSDWLHGSRQRSWHQSPLHWWWWHKVKPWVQMNWGIQQNEYGIHIVLFSVMLFYLLKCGSGWTLRATVVLQIFSLSINMIAK